MAEDAQTSETDNGALTIERLEEAFGAHRTEVRGRLDRLWAYYRNPLEPLELLGAAAPSVGEERRGWYRQAQEMGLPGRVTGVRRSGGVGEETGPRREVVIENDIGWRVQSMVEFLFGKPIRIESTAADAGVRDRVEAALERVWESSGGIAMLQDAATLGHVYGHVDLIVRVDEAGLFGGAGVDAVRIEPVEATRGFGLVSADDYRKLDAFVVWAPTTEDETPGRWPWSRGGTGSALRGVEVEVLLPGERVVLRDGEIVESSAGVLGGVAVAHVQNVSQPFRYSGLSEVEALAPLQDELNTRLSDRASRVTMQSFRMLLAKGIEGFDRAPVGPGTVWQTDNMEASIQAVAGDFESPSESVHIDEIREAMDKISAVPPLAGGVLRAKVGNLTSATALRVTLLGLLAKTDRKRVTYGRGIAQASGLVLEALNAAGVLSTRPEERGVRVRWPDPLPLDERAELAAAREKLEVGVDAERVLGELGYDPEAPEVQ